MVGQIDSAYRDLGYDRILTRLASWAFFEGRPHTTRGQWINPLVLAFLKLLRFIPGNTGLDRPVFVVGLGRSGTTLIGKILSSHPDVAFLNEGKAIWAIAKPETDICADYVTKDPRFQLFDTDADRSTKTAVGRMYSRYAMLTRNKRVVEKYPEMVFRPEFIKAIFPDAIFVVVTRDGEASIQSIASWSGKNSISETETWWGRDDIKWRTLRDEFLGENAQYADLGRLRDDELTEEDRAAIEWIITTDASLELISSGSREVFWLDYDLLLDRPRDVVSELVDATGLNQAGQESVKKYATRVVRPGTEYGSLKLHPVVRRQFMQTKLAMCEAKKGNWK